MSEDVTTTDVPADAAPVAKTYSESYVNQLRNEAAKYRVEKNEAVEAAKRATTEAVSNAFQSKMDALSADLGDAWVYAEKLHAAVESIHPESKALDFAAILTGADPESIRSSADKAKDLFGISTGRVTATDSTQGSGNGVPPLNGDPLLAKLTQLVGPPR